MGPDQPPTAVTLRHVLVRREGRTVLDIPHLELTEHRIGVVGANGSGKSTLLRLLDGLVQPDAGTVTVHGLDPGRDGRQVRRQVGFCFQDPGDQLIAPMVSDDVAFGLKNRGVPPGQRTTRVQETLVRLGVAHLRDRAVASLSGGERQLIALAGVLVGDPLTILFDEPTAMLDLGRARHFARLLATLPVQAVIASHDLDLLGDVDRVLVLDAGRIVADDCPEAALAVYRQWAAADLFSAPSPSDAATVRNRP